MLIKTWWIAECGWATYFREVAELSYGRIDVRIACGQSGIISLVEK